MVSIMKSVVAVMIVLAWYMTSLSCEVADDLVIFPAAEDITCNSAVISWSSDDNDRGRVEYGETKDYGLNAREDEDPRQGEGHYHDNELDYDYYHHVHLEGLRPEITYYYKVMTVGWLRDGSFTTKPPPSFALAGYHVIDNNGVESLQVQFTANVRVVLKLVNPDGIQVDSENPAEGVSEVVLKMHYDGRVEPGRYTLKANYGDTQIAAPTIDLAGPQLGVSEMLLTWSASGGTYALTNISMKVKNTGSLCADIEDIDASVDGRTSSFRFGRRIIWPGEEAPVTLGVQGISGVSPGQKTLILAFKDGAGELIGTYSAGVAPS
jgi:hypothetical protein